MKKNNLPFFITFFYFLFFISIYTNKNTHTVMPLMDLMYKNAVHLHAYQIRVVMVRFVLKTRTMKMAMTMREMKVKTTFIIITHFSRRCCQRRLWLSRMAAVTNGVVNAQQDLWERHVRSQYVIIIHANMVEHVFRSLAVVTCVCARWASMDIIVSTVSTIFCFFFLLCHNSWDRKKTVGVPKSSNGIYT